MYEELRLFDLLPNVFLSAEKVMQPSDVWRKDVVFEKGGKYLIEAESGTGKTSLCSFIMGMRNDYQGKIFFNGEDSSKFSPNKWSDIRRLSLAWLPQEIGLFENLTLLENLQIKNRLTKHLDKKTIFDYIERLGLGEKINSKAKFLSIGQQQRVAFIRMLCQPADFYLLDEPVSHLDYTNNSILADILKEITSVNGAGIIATSVGNRIVMDNLKELNL